MVFWNFCHNVLHMHVWLLPSLVIAAAMLIAAVVHLVQQKKHEKASTEKETET